jgi:colanic acid/amylovoran biosynthesis protein
VSKQVRILVLWANDLSPNLGVRVLGAGTGALLRRVWPDAEIVFHNYGARTAPVPLGSLRAVAKEAVTRRGGLGAWFKGFDLVVDTRSGDSFASIYGLDRQATMSASAEFAVRCKVPVVIGPQTIGPFDGRLSRQLARHSLRTAALVMARDSTSADAAARLGRPVDVLTTDVVFALDVPEPAASRDVVFNISGLLWQPNPHVDAARYRQTVSAVYDALVAEGRSVSLLAHVLEATGPDTDLPALREFQETHAPGAEILQPTSLTDVRQILRGASLVIGSRMHACLNALSVGTPAVALAYSRKFAPLLGDLGWQHVLDLRTDCDEIPKRVSELAARDELAVQTRQLVDRAAELLRSATDALGKRLSVARLT